MRASLRVPAPSIVFSSILASRPVRVGEGQLELSRVVERHSQTPGPSLSFLPFSTAHRRSLARVPVKTCLMARVRLVGECLRNSTVMEWM